MHTSRIRALVLIVIAVLAGALLIAPSADAAQRVSAKQKFLLVSTSFSDGAPMTIVATGALHASGKDIATGKLTDRFKFPDGNLNLRRELVGKGHDTFDKKACYGTYTEKGTWRISSGTGAYTDAKGHGRYTLLVQIFGCDRHVKPDQVVVMVHARGRLSY